MLPKLSYVGVKPLDENLAKKQPDAAKALQQVTKAFNAAGIHPVSARSSEGDMDFWHM